jgi:hypothetical protein
MYLPSSFCKGLKEDVPELKLDGYPYELDFPSFDLSVTLESPFANVGVNQKPGA